MEIRPVGAELFYAGGWMDRHDEANSRFSQFCERAFLSFLYFFTFIVNTNVSAHRQYGL